MSSSGSASSSSRARGSRSGGRLPDELPRLLEERQLTLRALAERIGVSHSHLSRLLRSRDGKLASASLARRTALALDLPEDFFAEVREERVIAALRSDGTLRDELYKRLTRPVR